MRHYAAATAVMDLRLLFLDYKREHDTEMAYAVLRTEPASSNLQLSPPGRRSTECALMGIPSDPSPEPAWRETRRKEAERQPLTGTALSETAQMPSKCKHVHMHAMPFPASHI